MNNRGYPKRELSVELASDVSTLAKGGVVQITGQFLSRGLNFVFVAVAIRVLGTAGFGLYRQVLQLMNVAALIAPGGFHFAGVRFIARARALKDPGGVRGAARTVVWGALISSTIVFLAVILGADKLASAFVEGASKQSQFANLVRLAAAFVPLFAMVQVLRFCTQAYKTMLPSVVVGNVVLPLAQVTLGVAALMAGFAVAGALLSWVASAALGLIAGIWYYRRTMTADERIASPRIEVAPVVKFALPQAGANLLTVQALGLGIIILGLLSGDREVGLFGVAVSLQSLGNVFLGSIVNIWAPIVTDLYESRQTARLETLYKTLNRWVATFSLPVFVVLMVKAEFLVQILMGRPESSAAVLVVVLACGNIISASTGPTSYVISMIGKPGINLMNSVVAIGLYAGLGFWLVPRHGALGMAFVDALVTALINITRVIQVKRLVGIQPFGRSFLKPVTAALVTAFSLMVWTVSPGQGNVNEAIGIIVAGAVYLGVLAILGLDAEERHVFNRIKSRLYAIGKSGS